MTLDRYDWIILNTLRSDGRISWAKLAEQTHLSASSTQRRVQAMQQAGIIRHFSLILNNKMLGQEISAFVQVKIQRNDPKAVRQFQDVVLAYEEVESCHKISGNMDFMLKVVAKDLEQFSWFFENKILYLPVVMDASSAIVLGEVKENGLPL